MKSNIKNNQPKRISVTVPEKLHIEMKLQARNRGTTLSKLIVKRFFDYDTE